MSISEVVAGEVRAWIARKRRSGRSVALELGWTQPYMSRRLNGEIPFNVDDLAAISEVLGVPVDEFLTRPGGRVSNSGRSKPRPGGRALAVAA